jgi:hypothetical protein
MPEPSLELLHRAADRIGAEGGTPAMDALADVAAQFLRGSDLTDEYGTPVHFTPSQALGYGILLGWLARGDA